jgi:hypothetical protein
MPQRHRDAYLPEFKTNLVALVLAGRSPVELADEFERSGRVAYEALHSLAARARGGSIRLLEAWDNPHCDSSLGYLSPVDDERRAQAAA